MVNLMWSNTSLHAVAHAVVQLDQRTKRHPTNQQIPAPIRVIQDSHCANLCFGAAGEGGMPPPTHRQCKPTSRLWTLDQRIRFRHQRQARRFRLGQSASFDKIERLRWVWTQHSKLGTQHFSEKAKTFAGPTAQWRVRSQATIHISNQLPVYCCLFQILFTVYVRGPRLPEPSFSMILIAAGRLQKYL